MRVPFLVNSNGDPELMALWKRFRDLSIIDFERMYKRLGKGLICIGENFFIKDAESAVMDCLEKRYAELMMKLVRLWLMPPMKSPLFLLRNRMARLFICHVY